MSNESPLQVYYPYGGIHYVLRWHTHHDQNHLILARSTQSLLQTAHHVFRENTDALIRDLLKIEIMAPSDAMCAAAREWQRTRDVNEFHRLTCISVRYDMEGNFPDGFKLCDAYEYNYSSEAYENRTEEEDEDHYDCTNCSGKIQLVGMSKEELFDRYHAKWLKENPDPCAPKNVYDSRAKKAQDGDRLCAYVPNFGHHSAGVWSHLNQDTIHQASPALFFYRDLEELDRSVYEFTLAGFKADEEAQKKALKDKRDAEWDQENKEKAARNRRVFEKE